MDVLESLDGGAVVVVSGGVLTAPYSAPLHIQDYSSPQTVELNQGQAPVAVGDP